MSTGPSFSTPMTQPAPIATAAEADALVAHFTEVMDRLVGIVQQETELVRAGRLTKAGLLQLNLTVLATAQAVSEGIVRGVSGEMARKSAPQTYGASGRANVPGRNLAAPLAVSRVL